MVEYAFCMNFEEKNNTNFAEKSGSFVFNGAPQDKLPFVFDRMFFPLIFFLLLFSTR